MVEVGEPAAADCEQAEPVVGQPVPFVYAHIPVVKGMAIGDSDVAQGAVGEVVDAVVGSELVAAGARD